MARGEGFTRSPLEKARQSRTLMIRSLDYQTRKHAADMTKRQERIAELNAEIERLEAVSSKATHTEPQKAKSEMITEDYKLDRTECGVMEVGTVLVVRHLVGPNGETVKIESREEAAA